MSDGFRHRESDDVATDVAGGIRATIRAAEQLANTIREDAERQAADTRRRGEEDARGRIDDAQREAEGILSAARRRSADAELVLESSRAITDELAAVRRARRTLDEALSSLGAAVDRLPRREPGSPVDGASIGTESRTDAKGDPPAAGTVHEVLRGKSGARLVAAQMALAGSSRAEVAGHLQRNFELPALNEVLDEVFYEREGRSG